MHLCIGSPEIDPDYQPDEATSRHFARIHGGHVLNLTDEEIAKEYANTRDGDVRPSKTIVGSVSGTLLSFAVSGVIIAVLVYICCWYGVCVL